MQGTKMNKKNLMVSFLAVISVLFLVATAVSAFTVTGDLADITNVKVNDVYANGDDIAVIAGETISVRVYFTSLVDGSDVRIKAELEGEKLDVDDRTNSFDVETGKSYSKTLTLKVPFDLKDEVSDDLNLNLKVWNSDYKTEIEDITLRVQRPSYNADIKSITVSKTIEAGENFPVDIVLKNTGYNDLDDIYVTVSLPALGIEKTSYFGDLVALEEDDDDDDETDTVSGRLYLKVPFDVEAGVYTLEVEIMNEDTVSNAVKQVIVENDFSKSVIATTLRKSTAVNEEAQFSLLIVNPTDSLKVYRVITESSSTLSSSVDESVVAVQAGSSKTVQITASADSEGEHDFNVDVFSGEELVNTVTLTLNTEGTAASQITSPIIVLTIILVIIFLVLLVVLIVLLSKKPEKAEDFGESYY